MSLLFTSHKTDFTQVTKTMRQYKKTGEMLKASEYMVDVKGQWEYVCTYLYKLTVQI